ncbi:hypothetical protein JOM56_008030 [Amanita muscaria]
MAPRSWATEDQQKFLQNQLDDFFAAQKAGKLMTFWAKVQKQWYHQWPEPGMEGNPSDEPAGELTASIQVRNKQLQNWFYNNRENNRNRGSRATPIVLNAKQKRTPSAVQLYSTEKYNTTIKSDVMSEIQEKNIPRNRMLEVVLRQTAVKFQAEPLEVQMHYKEKSKKLREQRLEGKKGATSVSEPSPASYDREIKNLTPSLEALLLDLHKRTGWSFLVLAGGPDPVSGKIRSLSFNEGQSVVGHTFAKSHPAFENDYIKPFMSYLKQAYPPAIREARRLVTADGNTPAISSEPTISTNEVSDHGEDASAPDPLAAGVVSSSISVSGIQNVTEDSDRGIGSSNEEPGLDDNDQISANEENTLVARPGTFDYEPESMRRGDDDIRKTACSTLATLATLESGQSGQSEWFNRFQSKPPALKAPLKALRLL